MVDVFPLEGWHIYGLRILPDLLKNIIAVFRSHSQRLHDCGGEQYKSFRSPYLRDGQGISEPRSLRLSSSK